MKRILSLALAAVCGLFAANWIAASRGVAPRPDMDAQAPAVRTSYPPGSQAVVRIPGGREERIHSLLNVDRKLRYGAFVWNENGVPEGPVWVRIDLAAQTLSVFRAGHEIGTAVILYGTDGYPTPTGAFAVKGKDKDRWSRSYNAPMPFALALTDDGVAIHASDVEKGFATHGCIGVPRAFARRLFDATSKGDLVLILPQTGRTAA